MTCIYMALFPEVSNNKAIITWVILWPDLVFSSYWCFPFSLNSYRWLSRQHRSTSGRWRHSFTSNLPLWAFFMCPGLYLSSLCLFLSVDTVDLCVVKTFLWEGEQLFSSNNYFPSSYFWKGEQTWRLKMKMEQFLYTMHVLVVGYDYFVTWW